MEGQRLEHEALLRQLGAPRSMKLLVDDGAGEGEVRLDGREAAAAASNVCPCIRLLLRTRTWRSVTIDEDREAQPRGSAREAAMGIAIDRVDLRHRFG
jgi:hypothetical protein